MTLADVWYSESAGRYSCDQIGNKIFYNYDGDYLAMCYNGQFAPIASVKFNYSKEAKLKKRVCWLTKKYEENIGNDPNTKYKCKEFTPKDKEDVQVVVNSRTDIATLNVYIYENNYHKENDHEIRNFPVAFNYLSSRDLNCDTEGGLDFSKAHEKASDAVYEDSLHENTWYKIKGKQMAEAKWKDETSQKYSKLERPVYLYKSEIFDWESFLQFCQHEPTGCEPITEEQLNYILDSQYADYRKGKSLKNVKKFFNSVSREMLNDNWINCYYLYNLAYINFIIQIFAIVFWACGRFLGLILGGGLDTPSEDEGKA